MLFSRYLVKWKHSVIYQLIEFCYSYNTLERDVQSQNDRPSCDDRLGNECFSWIPTRSKVNRLEVRAALTMSANIVPFWLCTFPVSIHALALYWCILLQADCYAVFHMTSYLRDFFMFHSIYNPVMFMVTNSEFQRALLHVAWKLKRGFNWRLIAIDKKANENVSKHQELMTW